MQTLYHCSPKGIVTEIEEDGLFWGVFASTDRQTTHGEFTTEFNIDKKDIATTWDLTYITDYENVLAAYDQIATFLENYTDKEKIIDAAINDDYDLLGIDYDADNSWELQRIRGQIAKHLGYKSVEMLDEYGTSYLILKI